jgi:hypothetical protein
MLKSPPKDLQIEVEKLTGFWRGVVEDNNDPLKAGRVRIRIHGIHTEKKIKNETEGIPTDELPWAEPCMPIHEGSVSGFGAWCVPLQGSQVMIFFENSNPSQPRYFASMPAIPESKEQYSNNNRATSKNDGFKDPDGTYPVKNRLGEPDFHRLSRGVSDETLVTTKNQERDLGVPTALGGNWDEPESPFAAKYPHNHVIATHGGITIELDSTPGSTRLHLYHPSNSFIEIDNEGNMVVKNGAEKYEIVTSGKNIHIKQQRNLSIDAGSKKRVGDDEEIEIGGSKIEEIAEDMTQTIGGDKTEDITADKTEDIGGNKTEDIGGNKSLTIGGNKTDDIGGDKSEDIGGDKTENIGGNLQITVSGITTLTSPTINLIGAVNITGLLSVLGGGGGSGGSMQGTLTIISGDVIADGISLKNHVHADPQGGNTSPPL